MTNKPIGMKVRPLDLSAILKHAFCSGGGVGENGKIPDELLLRWTDYDPEQLPPYQRIADALYGSKPSVNFGSKEQASAYQQGAEAAFAFLLERFAGEARLLDVNGNPDSAKAYRRAHGRISDLRAVFMREIGADA